MRRILTGLLAIFLILPLRPALSFSIPNSARTALNDYRALRTNYELRGAEAFVALFGANEAQATQIRERLRPLESLPAAEVDSKGDLQLAARGLSVSLTPVDERSILLTLNGRQAVYRPTGDFTKDFDAVKAWAEEIAGPVKSSWLRELGLALIPEARAGIGSILGPILIAAAIVGVGYLLVKAIKPKVEKAIDRITNKAEGTIGKAGNVIDKAGNVLDKSGQAVDQAKDVIGDLRNRAVPEGLTGAHK